MAASSRLSLLLFQAAWRVAARDAVLWRVAACCLHSKLSVWWMFDVWGRGGYRVGG